MAKFTLEINTGNAGMQSPSDLASALEKVAERIRRNEYPLDLDYVFCRGVMDGNGNTVGAWTLDPIPPKNWLDDFGDPSGTDPMTGEEGGQ